MGQGTSQQPAWIPACFGEERELKRMDKPVGFSARCFNLLAQAYSQSLENKLLPHVILSWTRHVLIQQETGFSVSGWLAVSFWRGGTGMRQTKSLRHSLSACMHPDVLTALNSYTQFNSRLVKHCALSHAVEEQDPVN